jgi:glycosyltransferase involved in cell wall biosynthesis
VSLSVKPLRIAFLTHEPFFPPSGGGSAEAVYIVDEMVRRGHEVHVFCPQIADAENVAKKFKIRLHQFTVWQMGRYAKLRNLKYLAYPFFLQRMVAAAARKVKFDLLLSQHAISAVAAGKLKKQLGIPVVMNFPDLLTGFMETWPGYVAPKPLVRTLMRYEISLPIRYGVDGVLAVSNELAGRFRERGFPREKVLPIFYGYDATKFPFRIRATLDDRPAVVVMHGSFDAHHLGEIAFGAIRHVTQNRPGTVFRFIGRRTPALEQLLSRAQKEIPGFKPEVTGFVPYAEVAGHLAVASVGIVPYEESAGTHCAFVAKVVEYVAVGLPTVCTRLKSIQSYFDGDPLVRFAEFNGLDFGQKILGWLDQSPLQWQLDACTSAARVETELDWQPLCGRAIDFVEKIYSDSAGTAPVPKR